MSNRKRWHNTTTSPHFVRHLGGSNHQTTLSTPCFSHHLNRPSPLRRHKAALHFISLLCTSNILLSLSLKHSRLLHPHSRSLHFITSPFISLQNKLRSRPIPLPTARPRPSPPLARRRQLTATRKRGATPFPSTPPSTVFGKGCQVSSFLSFNSQTILILLHFSWFGRFENG